MRFPYYLLQLSGFVKFRRLKIQVRSRHLKIQLADSKKNTKLNAQNRVFSLGAIIIPQIAIAIGVLTSNKGGGRRTTLADWTWHQGAIAGCSGRGATAGCHRRVPL